jgi:hypothetical protein
MAERLSEQIILEKVYDTVLKALVIAQYGYDGQSFQRMTAEAMNRKIVKVGSVTYIAQAAPGTAESTAKWQAYMVDSSVEGTTLITWADGDANFDNVATNLSGLTYS